MKVRLIVFLILFTTVVGCRSKKETVSSDIQREVEVRVDTVIVKEKEVEKIFLPSSSKINIPFEFDSFNKIKPFKFKTNNDIGEFVVEADSSGRLSIETNNKEIRESLKLRDSIFKSNRDSLKETDKYESKVIVKTKIPFWIWTVGFISLLVNFLFIRAKIIKRFSII